MKIRYVIMPLIIIALWVMIGWLVYIAALYSDTYFVVMIIIGSITALLAVVFLILTGIMLDYLGLHKLMSVIEKCFERLGKFW